MLKDHRWLLEPIVATACCVAVLLVTAGTPSADEFYKGISGGLAVWFAGRVMKRGE